MTTPSKATVGGRELFLVPEYNSCVGCVFKRRTGFCVVSEDSGGDGNNVGFLEKLPWEARCNVEEYKIYIPATEEALHDYRLKAVLHRMGAA